jgi:hypothetical protein
MAKTIQDLSDDLDILQLRLEDLDGEEPIKISGIYCWCYSREEFVQTCKLLGTTAEPNYQATNMTLTETLPGGLRIQVQVDYQYLQDPNRPRVSPLSPLSEPPAITKYVLDPEMVKLIEGKIGAELPKI